MIQRQWSPYQIKQLQEKSVFDFFKPMPRLKCNGKYNDKCREVPCATCKVKMCSEHGAHSSGLAHSVLHCSICYKMARKISLSEYEYYLKRKLLVEQGKLAALGPD